MKKKEFQKAIQEEMRKRFPEMEISIESVEKRDSYIGLQVRKKGERTGIAINLDAAYSDYLKNDDYTMTCAKIETQIIDEVRNAPTIDIDGIGSYETIRPKLSLQLIPAPQNGMLENVPHTMYADLALIYRIELFRSDNGGAFITINNELLKKFEISKEQLHQDAVENSMEQDPIIIQNIEDILGMEAGLGLQESVFYCITNKRCMNGASVLAYPDFADQVAKRLEGNFYILPSSIHELMLLKDDGKDMSLFLDHMIQEVNRESVKPEERLSDHAYYYDSQKKIFEIASVYEERKQGDIEELRTDEIKGLLIEPNQYPKAIMIKNESYEFQNIVGEKMTEFYPFEDSICVMEGNAEGLPLNRAIKNDDGSVRCLVAGPMLVIGVNNGNYCSLTPRQMKQYEEMFHQPEVFLQMGRKVLVRPIPDEILAENKKTVGQDKFKKNLGER